MQSSVVTAVFPVGATSTNITSMALSLNIHVRNLASHLKYRLVSVSYELGSRIRCSSIVTLDNEIEEIPATAEYASIHSHIYNGGFDIFLGGSHLFRYHQRLLSGQRRD